MRIVACALTLLLTGSVAMVSPQNSSAAPRTLDPEVPAQVELTLCTDDRDLDCIEALGLVTAQGFVPGYILSKTTPVVSGPVRPGGSESGPTNGTTTRRNEIWRIPGLQTESGLDTVNPNIAITTPGLRWYASDSGQEYDALAIIGLDVFTGRGIDVPVNPPCVPDLGTCWREENILPGQVLKVVIRVSNFTPAWALSPLGDTVLKIDALGGGGSRITVQGYALNGPGFYYGGGRPLPHLRNQFDYTWYRWSVHLYNANDPRFPERCSKFGFPLIAGNQYGTGIPTWNSFTRQMDLNMSAPHLDEAGKAFRGHYEAFLPAAYARCLWKAEPRRLTNQLKVEVTSEDGREKVATTSIQFRDGGVRIVAENFTFSSPTVSVRPKTLRR